jgi:hypothetical protein
MKALNGRYALRFNRKYARDAHLFKNRFGAVLQDTETQLLWTLRYAVRNPVESGLCAQPEEWPMEQLPGMRRARPGTCLSSSLRFAFVLRNRVPRGHGPLP